MLVAHWYTYIMPWLHRRNKTIDKIIIGKVSSRDLLIELLCSLGKRQLYTVSKQQQQYEEH